MASLVLTNAMTLYGTAWASGTAPGPANPTVSGTLTTILDLSDHIKQITLNTNAAMQDFTTFGDGAFIAQKPGLKGADLTIDFNQDFAASNIDAVFGAGELAGTLFYFDIKPTNAGRSATNPSWVFATYVMSYPPISQSVGDRAATSIGFAVTGTYARLTS